MPLIFRTIRQSNQKAHPNADTCRRTSSSVKQGEPWLLIPPVYQSIESNRLLSTLHLSFHCRSSLTSQEMWTQTQRNKTHKYEVRLLMLHYSEPLPYAVESTDSQWKHLFSASSLGQVPYLTCHFFCLVAYSCLSTVVASQQYRCGAMYMYLILAAVSLFCTSMPYLPTKYVALLYRTCP